MRLHFILIVAIYLFQTNYISAQITLTGKVFSKHSGEPMAGVSIYFDQIKTGATTDKNGRYQVPKIRPGKYILEVSSLGYQSITMRLELKQDTVINFMLEESTTELNAVVVTAVSHSTELKNSPIIIKPIDINALYEGNSTNLIDGLKNVPGISQITTGAGISKPTIRGLGYNRVITLYNGIRQEGQQWGDEHGIEIDEYAVDRIEIVKGPGSLMYGSDGVAGVLNFISPKSLPLNTVKTKWTSNYQSNNQMIGNSISYAANKKGLRMQMIASNKMAGNYQNKYDGKVYNSGFQELNGSLFLGVHKTWGYTHLNISSFNTTLNMVEGVRDSAGNFLAVKSNGQNVEEYSTQSSDLKGYTIGIPHQQVNHTRIQSNNFVYTKFGSLNLDLGFQKNKRREFGDVINPNIPELFFDLNTINYNIRHNFKEHKGIDLSSGLSGMFQDSKNKGEEFLIPAYSLFDFGGFVLAQKTYNKKLTLAGGLRYDIRTLEAEQLILDSLGQPTTSSDLSGNLKFETIKKSYQNFSGSFGATYQIGKSTTLKANISRGYRAPNIAELSSNGQHEGSLRYEYGNMNLIPEVSHQMDLGYFYHSEHFTFELTPFANFISNYIYAQKLKNANGSDSIPDISNPSPAYKFAQGNAQLIGGELFMDLHPHPYDWLHVENTFSLVQASQTNKPDSTKYLPLIPAPKYRGVLKAQFKTVGKQFSNLYLKIGVDHIFEQNRYFSAYQTETKTPSYTLFNAGFGTSIKAYGRKDFFKFYLTIENLTNVAYQSHLSRLKYAPTNPLTGRDGVYNMGRNIGFKLITTI